MQNGGAPSTKREVEIARRRPIVARIKSKFAIIEQNTKFECIQYPEHAAGSSGEFQDFIQIRQL